MTLQEVLLTALSIIITGLATYLTTLLTSFITSKIKDEKLKKLLTELTTLINDEVNYTTQVYVSSLKDNNMFDEKAQQEALSRTLNSVRSKLSQDMIDYITSNGQTIEQYLTAKIESTIGSHK